MNTDWEREGVGLENADITFSLRSESSWLSDIGLLVVISTSPPPAGGEVDIVRGGGQRTDNNNNNNKSKFGVSVVCETDNNNKRKFGVGVGGERRRCWRIVNNVY